MSQFTSTLIDDEQLIEELRRYGEKNLPTLPQTSSGKTPKSRLKNQLNDSNRELYLKKLNHYKAREKADLNPSKHMLKSNLNQSKVNSKSRISDHDYYIKQENDEEDDCQIIEPEKDVVPLDSNETQYEYVQVSNAHTSPLSESVFRHDEPIASSSNHFTSTQVPKYPKNYVSLKDRIELDKTLSKYRSEINSILSSSIAKNRTFSNNLANEDVIYTGSVNNEVSSTTQDSKIMYCPRPTSSQRLSERKTIFDSIKTKFGSDSNIDSDLNSKTSPRISSRLGINKLKEENENLIKKKEPGFVQIKLIPFISHSWIQLSKFLPYLLIIILSLIAFQYLRFTYLNDLSSSFYSIKKNLFNSNSNKFGQNIVNNNINKNKIEHFYCPDIKDTQCSETKKLVRDVIDYLRSKSGQIDCSPLAESDSGEDHMFSVDFLEKCVHLNKIISYLTNERKLIKNKDHKSIAVDSVLKAMLKNQHWNIRLLNSSYVDTNQIDQVTYLMSTVSSKSFTCRFKELVHFIYVRFIVLSSFVLTVFLSYLTYKAIKQRQKDRDQKFFNLIKQVTELVEKQYDASLLDPNNIKPYIAISHVYDTLIEPSQRASKKKQWNEVIKFIQDHESRIHLETQFIDGEETLVWKWIVPKHNESVNNFKHINSNANNMNKNEGIGLANSTMITNEQVLNYQNQNKENSEINQNNDQNKASVTGWNGDAFNRSEKLAHSPTPCLKIRGMFDLSLFEKDSNLIAKIHNDILQKCTNGKNDFILHISCDKKSKEGCVYVKCLTNETAGRVYQCLNGTWYNGKLLNVKFLRSDRYLERFPESVNFNTPLQIIKF